MIIKLIGKKDINSLLRETVKDWDVYIPQDNLGADVWFSVLPKSGAKLDAALKNIVLEEVNTVISPKDICFPQLESMFEFTPLEKAAVKERSSLTGFKKGEIKETVESSAKLLFGVRPCDFKGIIFSDNFYKRNFKDKYYLSRMQKRFIVVIGCIKPPRPTCFCASAKTGPFADSGFDLQLVDNGDAYFVEVGSRQGEGFLKKHAKFFKVLAKGKDKTIPQIKKKAACALELKVDFQKALELMAQDNFVPEENYRRIGERCIYCGGCLYVCPTCTCFNVFDNTGADRGIRMRNWDACVFEGYTRETSGHNPRKEKWKRTSRRYEHKLKYDYQTTGMSGCIACGRCLSSCPVDIGISKFIQEITENRKIM